MVCVIALLISFRSRTLKSGSAPGRILRRSRISDSRSACTFSVDTPSRADTMMELTSALPTMRRCTVRSGRTTRSS